MCFAIPVPAESSARWVLTEVAPILARARAVIWTSTTLYANLRRTFRHLSPDWKEVK
jgi:hypothetical protein